MNKIKLKKILGDLSEEYGSQTALSRELGVNRTAVHNWITGYRPIPMIRAALLEVLTKGRYKAEDFSPDYKKIKEILDSYDSAC